MVLQASGTGPDSSRDGSEVKQQPPRNAQPIQERVADFAGEVIDMAAADSRVTTNGDAGGENGLSNESITDIRDHAEEEASSVRALGDVPGGELAHGPGRSGGVRGSPAPSSMVAEYWSGSETVGSVGEGDGSVIIPNSLNGIRGANGVNGVNGHADTDERDTDSQPSRQGENGSLVAESVSAKDGSEFSESIKSVPVHDNDSERGDKETENVTVNDDRGQDDYIRSESNEAVDSSPVLSGDYETNNYRASAEEDNSKDDSNKMNGTLESEQNSPSAEFSVAGSADAVVRSAINRAAELYESSGSENDLSRSGGRQASGEMNSQAASNRLFNAEPNNNPGPNKAAMQKDFYDMMKRMVPDPQQQQTGSAGVPFGDFHARLSGRLHWTQTIDSVTVSLCVPTSTKSKELTVNFSPDYLFASAPSEEAPFVDAKLNGTVSVDDCMWSLETKSGSCVLTFELEKSPARWWSKLLASDDPTTYKISSSSMPPPISPDKSHASSDGTASSSKKPTTSAPSTTIRPIDPRVTGPLNQIDMTELIATLRKNIESDGPGARESASKLAELYYQGIGVEKNYAEAVSLYKFALVKSGVQDDHAACQLGRMYNMGGYGISKEPEEAFRWWRIASGMGNVVATHNVGVLYLHGDGCEADPIQAEQYFKKARTLDAKIKQRLAERNREKTEAQDPVVSAREAQERERMREAGIQTMKYTLYGTCAVIGVGLTTAAILHWWRNRL
eukprot:Plantae.Rhodophyta-Hildenbrandia_rubra.ctg4338.p1 GENE.Plantae.Rhodophyta-Hildenbrandia_rubra.ctg4338~~Plantae.Rhodophyta-Hildenbrandia_rubra.ctg4338.p1  ORF type:complete len:732 (-),score=132.95 Plantae.Rhodophyta-Hildenbrandia_rubra.ctg4338:1405-3600(-)